MKKNRKVQRLLIENGLEQINYSLVLNLKNKIIHLEDTIQQQTLTIQNLKRDQKSTKIGEMQVQIAHLQDQNKRLAQLLCQRRQNPKKKQSHASKKHLLSSQKYENRRPIITQFKCDSKVNQILKQNENLRRQLTSLKVNQSVHQKRKTAKVDRESLFQERNILQLQQLQQKKLDLEQQSLRMSTKVRHLQGQIKALATRNEELEKIHFGYLHLNCQ